MHETLRAIPVGEKIVRVDNYTPDDLRHGLNLDRALQRLEQVEKALGEVKPGQPKSVDFGVTIPTETGDKIQIVHQTPAMHRSLTNRVFNERKALHESGREALADEIIASRTGIIFEAKETMEEHIAKNGAM